MKKILPLLALLPLCVFPLAAQNTDTANGKGPPPASSQVSPPAAIETAVRLEAERAAIRGALIAELKAAEKQAAEAAKTGDKQASAALWAESIRKQKAQSARLQKIAAQLDAIRPEAKASQPGKAR